MKQYREWSLASLFVCLFFLCGCDSTSMKDVAVSSPEILSFSPESGSIGSEIVVTGEYLDDVVSATIGGGKARYPTESVQPAFVLESDKSGTQW